MALKNIALLLVFVLTVVAFVEARHIHPGSDQLTDSTQELLVNLKNDNEPAKTESGNIVKPIKYSPLMRILFFKYTSCEEGYERDYLGICREVWF